MIDFSKSIHNIEGTPFRTKFEHELGSLEGEMGIGCISDFEAQPILVRSHHGTFAITTVSKINNADEINPTELVAAIINQKDNLIDGICKKLKFTSLRFHRFDDMLETVGIDPDHLCTYCWNGKE